MSTLQDIINGIDSSKTVNKNNRRNEILDIYRDMGRTKMNNNGFETIISFYYEGELNTFSPAYRDLALSITKQVSAALKASSGVGFYFDVYRPVEFMEKNKESAHYALYEYVLEKSTEAYTIHMEEQYGADKLEEFKGMEAEFFKKKAVVVVDDALAAVLAKLK